MFDTVLIANRGEIALRIQRACRGLGLRTVAVHSEADRDAPHVRAGRPGAVHRPGGTRQSYLNQVATAGSAAEVSGARPSTRAMASCPRTPASWQRVEQDAGLTFIGPSAACIRTMGDKVAAKRAMRAAGVPCVPGPDEGLPEDPGRGARHRGARSATR